jgi:hypothetical protein
MARSRIRSIGGWGGVVLLVALMPLLPATSGPKGRPATPEALSHISQAPVIRNWIAHPEQAPEALQSRFQQMRGARALGASGASESPISTQAVLDDVFNQDTVGLPQNEESISGCRSNPELIIEGTNDYRGLLDPRGNFTGWHLSTDGGQSVAKEGLLPPVRIGGSKSLPSGGDPVFSFSEVDCDIYAVDLNYNPEDPFGDVNGIGIYMTTVETLLSPQCGDDGAADQDCWPNRRYAAFSPNPTHFFDKPWFDVGVTGPGERAWVVYSDFDLTPRPPNPAGFTAEIFAVRCSASLSNCTSPIPISGHDVDVQFGDVTIGPDERTYVTWSQIRGELEGTPQTFIHKLRVAQPGSLAFGPEQRIAREELAIPFGGFLHANDFRIATYPKNEIRMIGDDPRIYVVWDACTFRPLGFVCEEPVIKLRFSDDFGNTWSPTQILSDSGDNYFPTIGLDPVTGDLAVAWFTNRNDALFHNQQDVELVTIGPSGNVLNRQIITLPSNESEADPILGGFFIGDYIEVFAQDGIAWVGYNMNYRHVPLLGEGIPIPQQDNYVTTASM